MKFLRIISIEILALFERKATLILKPFVVIALPKSAIEAICRFHMDIPLDT